jgi:class 3 adenylate cyclase
VPLRVLDRRRGSASSHRSSWGKRALPAITRTRTADIKDFTATTDRLQPEELAGLLNEYLTEMSAIFLKWGGTIDKFIGDAMVVFFGDPETKGVAEDAARIRKALQDALDALRPTP